MEQCPKNDILRGGRQTRIAYLSYTITWPEFWPKALNRRLVLRTHSLIRGMAVLLHLQQPIACNDNRMGTWKSSYLESCELVTILNLLFLSLERPGSLPQ